MSLPRRFVPYEERKSKQPIAIDAVIASADFLPAAFELIPRLLVLLDDTEINCDEVAEVIRVDPGLTANVLRISNSAFLGGGKRVDRLSEAIIRVGFREIFRLVLTIVTAPVFTSQEAFRLQKIDLWKHSLSTAVATQFLAGALTDTDPEVAFTAGLLHDIGKPVLARAAGPEYIHLLAACAENHVSVFDAEHDAFRVNHAEVAGRLLQAWRFPSRVIESIVHHHTPTKAGEHAPLAALVYLGNIISYRISQANGFPLYAADPDPDTLALLQIDLDQLTEAEPEVIDRFRYEQQRFL